MPEIMSKKCKTKQLKAQLSKEFDFIQNVFSVLNLPTQKVEDENADYEIVNSQKKEETEMPKRARNIAELEEKLQKIKSQRIFNLKNKLAKKSLSSKLNKQNKKKERKEMKKNRIKTHVKGQQAEKNSEENRGPELTDIEQKVKPTVNKKPVFNSDAKLVFSKFDFSNLGSGGKPQKQNKNDPKKILENLKEQEQKFKELENDEESGKAQEMKEKIAWKNLLQKAEGEKIKDDPILLKKSIKRLEQKKKHSKKQWDGRIQGVEQKKEERQKKRTENISKKKKEKKAKVVKAAIKRGRVVI